ncbi:Squalene/phytoene synthase [Melioribacter roseus P3M-2]|uniref:Squalene/phytoene synthase n=1 Tax=Melioribacter roseus (strain DSM 23840 / JCM 17771 / VKM B-2668 / P3M-2) TaxID=1191523 RepID=I6ZVN4_MELRP|nr:squalene synthase HpnC [Melioribacter roseus]AFN76059.1 Squalene/phytoene synthase [Melioribacter roseus P3M-2]
MINKEIDNEYNDALEFARKHYENFPVASLFLPAKLRKHVAIIYKFARTADDIADEGDSNVKERLENISLYRFKLSNALDGNYYDNFWAALDYTIKNFNLTEENFFNLLNAFESDITVNRFETFDNVLEYCRNSANPVGRIILELFDIRVDEIFDYSDSICTGLQLTNFYQDISIDFMKNRLYIPLDEMKEYRLDDNKLLILNGEEKARFRKLMKLQVARNRKYYEQGEKIISALKNHPNATRGLICQLKLTILGGNKILDYIENNDYDTFEYRPTLKVYDLIMLFFKALLK